MALRDQPYIPLYVQDFLTDEKLIECSAATTGVYIRLMCIMHKSAVYGKILLEQKYKQSVQQVENFACKLDRQMPYTKEEIKIGIQELINEKVVEISGDYLIQKRMVKDNEISIVRSESGRKGGEATKFAKAKVQAKSVAKPEDESEDEVQEREESEKREIENYKTVVKSYNEVAERNSNRFPSVLKDTDDRITKVKNRIKQNSIDEVIDVFFKADFSEWLSGREREGWCANFDWLMEKKNFDKVLEGNMWGLEKYTKHKDAISEAAKFNLSVEMYEMRKKQWEDGKYKMTLEQYLKSCEV